MPDREKPEEPQTPEREETPAAEPAAPAAPAAEEPQPWGAGAAPRRTRRTLLWVALGIVVLGAAAVIAWPALRGLAPRGVTVMLAGGEAQPDAALAAVRARLDRLEAATARLDELQAAVAREAARIEALEQRPAAAGAAPPAVPDERIAALAQRLEALEQRPADEDADAVAALEQRLAGLEQRLGTLDDRAARDREQAALARVSAENERLAAALERTTQKVAGLEAQLAAAETSSLGEAVKGLAGRLDGLEAEARRLAASAETRRGDALTLAVGQLRDALDRARPFAAELEAVRRIAGDDPVIAEATAPLAPLAARGIPTAAELERRFPALATRAAQAAIAPEAGDWLDRTVARLARVVTVRRVGADVAGGSALAALARAEAKLAAGDLAGAAAALDGLTGKPAEVLGEWRAAAAARAAAASALERLSRHAIDRLAAAGGGK